MKKVFLVVVAAVMIVGCKKKDGAVELTISYYYNNYQGYKPDVGAKVYIFDKDVNCSSMSLTDAQMGIIVDKNGNTKFDLYKYSSEADVNGVVKISVQPAEYYIVVASKGRYLYSMKKITVKSEETLYLTKNFYYLGEFKDVPESW